MKTLSVLSDQLLNLPLETSIHYLKLQRWHKNLVLDVMLIVVSVASLFLLWKKLASNHLISLILEYQELPLSLAILTSMVVVQKVFQC